MPETQPALSLGLATQLSLRWLSSHSRKILSVLLNLRTWYRTQRSSLSKCCSQSCLSCWGALPYRKKEIFLLRPLFAGFAFASPIHETATAWASYPAIPSPCPFPLSSRVSHSGFSLQSCLGWEALFFLSASS